MSLKISLSCMTLLMSFAAQSAPAFLLTHNHTDVESNAYIITRDGGSIPSIYPTKANSDSKVYWNMVKLACHGHTVGNLCSATIKMATNTPNPVDVGVVTMDLASGEITPKELSGNGYTVVVNGLGETTISQP